MVVYRYMHIVQLRCKIITNIIIIISKGIYYKYN